MFEPKMRAQKSHRVWLEASLEVYGPCVLPVRLPARFLPAIFLVPRPRRRFSRLNGVQVAGNPVTMGKKKSSSNAQTPKPAAKAANKAKAAKKTNRKTRRN